MAVEMPDEINVDRHDLGPIRIQFGFDGKEPTTVWLDQDRLQSLIALLAGKSEHSALSPISKDLVHRGQKIAPFGHSAKRKPDGSLDLTMLAEVDGRRVTISFEMSPTETKNLRRELSVAND